MPKTEAPLLEQIQAALKRPNRQKGPVIEHAAYTGRPEGYHCIDIIMPFRTRKTNLFNPDALNAFMRGLKLPGNPEETPALCHPEAHSLTLGYLSYSRDIGNMQATGKVDVHIMDIEDRTRAFKNGIRSRTTTYDYQPLTEVIRVRPIPNIYAERLAEYERGFLEGRLDFNPTLDLLGRFVPENYQYSLLTLKQFGSYTLLDDGPPTNSEARADFFYHPTTTLDSDPFIYRDQRTEAWQQLVQQATQH